MNRKERDRLKSLFDDNFNPRLVAVYDNDGETVDRYGVVFTGRYRERTGGEIVMLTMNATPHHPYHGFCQHLAAQQRLDAEPGRRGGPPVGGRCAMGKRIAFDELPEDCRKIVLSDYCSIWSVSPEALPERVRPSHER